MAARRTSTAPRLIWAIWVALWLPACVGLRPGMCFAPPQGGIGAFRRPGGTCHAAACGPRLVTARGLQGGMCGGTRRERAGVVTLEASGGAGERVAALNEWLRDRGILRESAEVGECGEMGLGLRATREISGNQEVLLEVPPEHFITEETAVAALGELGAFIKATLQDALIWGTGGDVSVELGDALIALRLMQEMAAGDASVMKPYIDMLPERVDTPLFWPEGERDRLLAGCLILQDTKWLQSSIDNQWALVYDMVIEAFPDVFPPDFFNLDRFRYCVALSIFRAYSADGISGVGGGLMLLPGIDMTNHADEVQFAVQGGDGVFAERGSVSLVSDRGYSPGDQIFTTYGRKSNAQMLYAFGFTREDPHHPSNSADIALHLPEDDPLRERKQGVLAAAGMYPRMRFQVPVKKEFLDLGLQQSGPGAGSKGGVGPMFSPLVDSWGSVLPFARLSCVGAEGLEGMIDDAGGVEQVWPRFWQPLDGDAEAAAREALGSHLTGRIEALERPVGGGVEGERARVAAIARVSEAAALRQGRSALRALAE